jgi:thioredoxin reductase (NADPH)
MHDLIILGTGPAGLSASIYASRYKIDHLLIGAETGGYLNEIHKIENYPGFSSVSGFELAQKMKEHVEFLGEKILEETVMDVEKKDDFFIVKAGENEYKAKNIIYSIGTQARKLNIPGENELKGKGVSYCATCDGPFFKEKNVVVVGGANSAAVAALILSEHATKVTMFYRGGKPRCTPSYLEQMEKNPKIDIVCCTNLKEIKGDEKVESIILDAPYENSNEFKTDGVFIEVGSDPATKLTQNLDVELSEQNYIKTKPDQSTNVEGFFAAGDITTNSNGFRQIITACSEGAISAFSVYEKLKG